jgi:hypothetical protein
MIEPVKRKRDNQGGLFRLQIRALLRQHPEGMTLKHMNERIPGKGHSLYRALKRMPDAYVSHWIDPVGEKQQAVYKVVMVPPDAPRPPQSKMSHEERKAYLREYHRARKAPKKAASTKAVAKPKPSPTARLTHEEMQARNEAMINRYSNPPTYKPLK